MRNNNSTPVFDQTPGCKTVLGAATTNITPVSHKSFTITEDGDLILIRFHESPPLTRLIVPHREVWSFCPPWSPAAPVRCFICCWLSHSLHSAAECDSWFRHHSVGVCVLPDEVINSFGPVDTGKNRLSVNFKACVFPVSPIVYIVLG